MHHLKIIFVSILSFFASLLPIKMIPANTIIGLQATMTKIANKTTLPIVFPQKIPHDASIKTYYASTALIQVPYGINYIINVDRTKECHGAHYCNIGSLRAEKKVNPRIYHDRNDKEITTTVKLSNDRKAYFTPSHAMGDFWPATLQWRDNSTLYTLSWNIDPKKEKKALLKMANTIKTPQH